MFHVLHGPGINTLSPPFLVIHPLAKNRVVSFTAGRPYSVTANRVRSQKQPAIHIPRWQSAVYLPSRPVVYDPSSDQLSIFHHGWPAAHYPCRGRLSIFRRGRQRGQPCTIPASASCPSSAVAGRVRSLPRPAVYLPPQSAVHDARCPPRPVVFHPPRSTGPRPLRGAVSLTKEDSRGLSSVSIAVDAAGSSIFRRTRSCTIAVAAGRPSSAAGRPRKIPATAGRHSFAPAECTIPTAAP